MNKNSSESRYYSIFNWRAQNSQRINYYQHKTILHSTFSLFSCQQPHSISGKCMPSEIRAIFRSGSAACVTQRRHIHSGWTALKAKAKYKKISRGQRQRTGFEIRIFLKSFGKLWECPAEDCCARPTYLQLYQCRVSTLISPPGKYSFSWNVFKLRLLLTINYNFHKMFAYK
jgi:hypothetical protein